MPRFPRRCAPGTVPGRGVRAPGPGRNNGLNALPRLLGAQGIDIIGRVRDQAGQRRVRPGGRPSPDLGAVAGLAAHHAQAQGTALSIRQDMIWVLKRP